MRPSRLPFLSTFLQLSLAAMLAAPSSFALGEKDWIQVDPAHLLMKAPMVERDADAEILFWEVRVTYDTSGGEPATTLSHYVRLKVFTERGRDAHSKIDIYAPKVGGREIKIRDVAGRTIKPDGTMVELRKEDVFERDVLKTSGLKVRAKSFAMPAVEPGSILEYRWREVRNGVRQYERFDFSREIPVQFVRYYIKPASDAMVDSSGKQVGLRAQTFNGQTTPFVKEKDGSYGTTMANVGAFREEPHMPPEYAVRPWMLVFYSSDQRLDPAQYWRAYGKRLHDNFKSPMKVSDEVRRAAAEAAGDAVTPEQKIERIYNFVRAKVRRVTDDALGLTPDQLKKIKENKSPSDTLKRGMGTAFDIDMLFAAMASASGFDVRVAATSDRGDVFFDPTFPDDYFINPASIAVRVGDQWRLFNPGSTYVPFGMLRWQEEGQQTIIADPKEPIFIVSPKSEPSKSLEKRTGKFKLSEDGTLEGEVVIEYTGHIAADVKEYNDDETPQAREELLKEKIKARIGAAELTDVRVENVTDPDKPFVYAFRIRVPGYAQRTGKRLFLQPAFFQYGKGAPFLTSARRHHVYFNFPWAEKDHVEIELPKGFELDNADSPHPFGSNELSQYAPKLAVTQDGRTLIYVRDFFFGGGKEQGLNNLLFTVGAYGQIKRYFDEVHKQDVHTVSLKQSAGEGKE